MALIRFLCVSFNNAGDSKKLVRSLDFQQRHGSDFSVDCVIVDNSTKKEEAADCETLSRTYAWVTYLRAPTNLGYFGGLNYGMENTGSTQVTYTVICNNDLEFHDDFCRILTAKTYDQNIFAVCADVVTADGVHQNPHILNRINWRRRCQFDLYFSHYYVSRTMLRILQIARPVKRSPRQPSQGCEVHMGVGACYVLTAEFLQRFKRLHYPFFLYGEEAYIADQIHSAGGVLWFDPDLRVRHAESATLSKVPSRTAYEYARAGYPDYRRLM
jgi:GT2 family glycosyltransferase